MKHFVHKNFKIAKVEVAGSNPVSRSIVSSGNHS